MAREKSVRKDHRGAPMKPRSRKKVGAISKINWTISISDSFVEYQYEFKSTPGMNCIAHVEAVIDMALRQSGRGSLGDGNIRSPAITLKPRRSGKNDN